MSNEVLLADLLVKAEDIAFEAERAKLQWIWEKEQRALTHYRAKASRQAFLKAANARPLDVEEYEAFLAEYVATGQDLQRYTEGSYPRALQEQRGMALLLQQTQQELGIEVGSLEQDYYASDVIWHISEPMTLEELPRNLVVGADMALHLGQAAMSSFDADQIESLGADCHIHLYLDGMWRAGEWLNQARVWNAPVKLWEENLINLRATRKEPNG